MCECDKLCRAQRHEDGEETQGHPVCGWEARRNYPFFISREGAVSYRGGLSFNWHVYACGPLFRCQASIAIVGTYRPAIVWPGSARLWLVVGRDFCLASGGYHHQGLAER